MQTGALRLVLSDDADGQIQFSAGDWFTRKDSSYESAPGGTPYRQSQTGTNTTGSLSFTFQGSWVDLYGSVDVRILPSGEWDPSWECYLDGKRLELDPYPPGVSPSGTYVGFCAADDLDDSVYHTLTANITSRGRTLWVDQALYYPSSNLLRSPNNTNATVLIDVTEPAFRTLTGNWTKSLDFAWGGACVLTEEAGATALLEFIGSKLTAHVMTFPGFKQYGSTGTYNIDSGPEVEFRIPGFYGQDSKDSFLSQQFLFETEELEPGGHRISIRYDGPGAPLGLNQFIVESGDIVLRSPDPASLPALPTPSASTNSTAEPSALSRSTGSTPIGPGVIAGSVVGCVAFLALLLLTLAWWRRKKMVGGDGRPSRNVNIQPFDARWVEQASPATPLEQHAGKQWYSSPMVTEDLSSRPISPRSTGSATIYSQPEGETVDVSNSDRTDQRLHPKP